MCLLLPLLIFFFGNTLSKIPRPTDNDTPRATMGELYRIERFFGNIGNGAESKNLERMDKKIDDVKEDFVNLMEDVREIYHGPHNPERNSPTGQSSGN